MKRFLFAALIISVAAATLSAQETPDVKGTWNMTIESPQGPTNVALKLTVAEAKITGTRESPQGPLPVEGKLDGANLTLVGKVETPNGTIEITFTGKVTGDKMSGEVAFGTFGSGGWSATRAKG